VSLLPLPEYEFFTVVEDIVILLVYIKLSILCPYYLDVLGKSEPSIIYCKTLRIPNIF